MFIPRGKPPLLLHSCTMDGSFDYHGVSVGDPDRENNVHTITADLNECMEKEQALMETTESMSPS